MEKIKDILHDSTDVLVAIGIAALMFIVVTVNLGDWFGLGTVVLADTPTPVPVENPIVVTPPEEKEEIEVKPVEEPVTEEVKVESPKPIENPVTPPAEVVTVVELKRVVIPNGTPGVGVAKILVDNGLIENSNEFIKKAEELKLALKLKSGTFDIPTNATVTEMVKIIAK